MPSDVYEAILKAEAGPDGQKRGRGKAEATRQLIAACHEILSEIQPATVRAVCYRLFTRRLISDMGKGATDKASKQLVWARENRIIPWEWIVDETREAERISSWSSPEAIIRVAVERYRRNYWQDQSHLVEIWSEKGTVRGTVGPVLRELGVTFRVMHGFTSATSANGIAEESRQIRQPLIALYVGDHDPSGMYMSEVDLPERIRRYGGEVHIERIALVPEDLPGLPSFPARTKQKDARYRWFVDHYGPNCWELDALPPPVLRERVREKISRYIDWAAWNRAVEVEAVEIESMREFHAEWHRRVSGAA